MPNARARAGARARSEDHVIKTSIVCPTTHPHQGKKKGAAAAAPKAAAAAKKPLAASTSHNSPSPSPAAAAKKPAAAQKPAAVASNKMAGGGKAIEDIYQKKTQLEHILLRPDTYIGSTEKQAQQLWVHDGAALACRQITYAPGLFKIFDEILVNAADNKVRDPSMDAIKVTIDQVSRS